VVRSLPAGEPACAQDERNYAVFDALFLQRNNAAINRPLVVAGSSGTSVPVIMAGDPTSTIGTGARLLYGNYGEDDIGWEVGYLGVYGMNSASTATSAGGSLEAPDPNFATQSGLNGGFSARVTDNASINSAEVNLVFHEYDGGYNRRSGRPWQRCDGYDGGHVDWIGGFRWANLQDEAVLAIPRGSSPQSATYTVDASSNLFAAQVGTRGRMAFERWAVEGWMKIGIAGTLLSQSQTLFDPLPANAVSSSKSIILRQSRHGDDRRHESLRDLSLQRGLGPAGGLQPAVADGRGPGSGPIRLLAEQRRRHQPQWLRQHVPERCQPRTRGPLVAQGHGNPRRTALDYAMALSLT
jgi:hypothetical protein